MMRPLPFAASALAGALILALVLALTGGAPGKATSATWNAPDGSFAIETPRGWKSVASGSAATVLQRADKRGLVVIRRGAPVTDPLDTLATKLERKLRGRIADFRSAGARLARVGTGGQALVYTFVRPRANRVQSVVVAPAGDRSYTLDLVAHGDAPDVARELAGMVRSFSPRG
jgi:hypothetical protein